MTLQNKHPVLEVYMEKQDTFAPEHPGLSVRLSQPSKFTFHGMPQHYKAGGALRNIRGVVVTDEGPTRSGYRVQVVYDPATQTAEQVEREVKMAIERSCVHSTHL